jgi:hypothetical protein
VADERLGTSTFSRAEDRFHASYEQGAYFFRSKYLCVLSTEVLFQPVKPTSAVESRT